MHTAQRWTWKQELQERWPRSAVQYRMLQLKNDIRLPAICGYPWHQEFLTCNDGSCVVNLKRHCLSVHRSEWSLVYRHYHYIILDPVWWSISKSIKLVIKVQVNDDTLCHERWAIAFSSMILLYRNPRNKLHSTGFTRLQGSSFRWVVECSLANLFMAKPKRST